MRKVGNTVATIAAGAMLATTVMPALSAAEARERYRDGARYEYDYSARDRDRPVWHHKKRRKWRKHRYAERRYYNDRPYYKRRKKRKNLGKAIAIGMGILALGIIASGSKHHKRHRYND